MERFIEPLVRAGISESTIEDILCKIDEAQEVISEDLSSQISRKYGNTEKAKELRGKARETRWEEEEQAAKREGKSWDDIIDKRNDTKDTLGRDKTSNKQMMPKEMAKRKKAHEIQKVVEALINLVEEIKDYDKVRGITNGGKPQLPVVKAQPKKEVELFPGMEKIQRDEALEKIYAPIKKSLAAKKAAGDKLWVKGVGVDRIRDELNK